jgi:hypothetical protein
MGIELAMSGPKETRRSEISESIKSMLVLILPLINAKDFGHIYFTAASTIMPFIICSRPSTIIICLKLQLSYKRKLKNLESN